MTAIEHFEAREQLAGVRREAYRIVGHAITDWLENYALTEQRPVSVEVRLELERIRDQMQAAGQVPTVRETIEP